ncbi:MAG TPA: bifunctional oligoribonuclease/PAP phosphatase NrnA [Clostridia bacterium]|nr:bifunctional oligoribonuclease/PAP phosphatase NrnA [Clostridia bacterium]
MKINLTQVVELLHEKDNILILTHSHPDGDTLGSGYALCKALRDKGKNANVKCGDTIPKDYNFIVNHIKQQDFNPEFIVAVDVADEKLLGDEFEKLYSQKIDLCIDHHSSNTGYAKKAYIDPKSAAAAEIIYDIICMMDIEIDKYIADCIYTGVSTDTGCFRYSNTSSRSHRIAAAMIDAGADTSEIDRVFFETKTKSYAQLERLALDTLEMHFDDRCAIMTVTQEMLSKTGSNSGECDKISSLPRQIEGVFVGATIREQEDGGVKVSVRTHPPVDAAQLCRKMDGGGHIRAAGCKIDAPIEKAKQILLNNIKEVLN